ncbi:MAG: hypothetical protein CR972_04160 [Candidatus Moraniibacteriota bacterium]|nr:MAG: hypothetical protein CR972_04160 [Candidatus Moranbacteria bacterium]
MLHKKRTIIIISIGVLLTASIILFYTQKNNHNTLRTFDLNGTKISFIPPHGWECGVFPWQDVAMRGDNGVICAKNISSDIMNQIGGDYVRSKGSGPYYDEIVKNSFGEVFLLYPENSSEEEMTFLMDKEHVNTEYSQSEFITIAGKEFKSTIITRGRKNASTILLPYERKIVIMTSILPEYRTAHITPTRKVRQILETISVEENNVQ